MKKIFVFLITFLVVSGAVFAEETVMIDFNEILDDYQGEHQATFVDFSSVVGTRFTPEEKAEMNTSLYVPNWNVRLSSSSRTVTNDSLSYVRAVNVNDTDVAQFSGEQVMGVRVHFPTGAFNSYAWIEPPFVIPAYATNPTVEDAPQGDQFNGFGVVKNVGVIKSIKANVYGMKYPVGFSIVISDEEKQTQAVPMGYLDYEGWRELTWNNPNYIAEVRNREVRNYSLYPRVAPSITLESLQIYRDAMKEGGDYIGYFKDITVVYDQAVIQEVDGDLNHEEIWGILGKREAERRQVEVNRIANREILLFLEQKRMHQDAEGDVIQ